jgi:hypothetical protein
MSFRAVIGVSQNPDSLEAGEMAARMALEQAGREPIAFGWLMVSHIHAIGEVLAGVSAVLGNVPLMGVSTSSELTANGRSRRSVVLAALVGGELQARAGWWGSYAEDARLGVEQMLRSLRLEAENGDILLLAADGVSGNVDALRQSLTHLHCDITGCLAGGELWKGRTYQVGGRQSGSGGLGAAVLSGDIVIGQGAAHGWQSVGVVSRITSVKDHWLRALDDKPVSELYARLFGKSARAWVHPPLSELVRLYPLGRQEAEDMVLYSPLRMEADGSLRMNGELPTNGVVELMVGSPERCRQAAQQAARQAKEALGPTMPRLVLVFVDEAWRALFELEPRAEVEAVQEVIGADTPIMGGYTFGQIMRPTRGNGVQILNQHILVVLFGVRSVEVGGVVA